MPEVTAPPPPVAAPAAPPPAPTPAPAASGPPINSVTKKPVSDAAHKLFKMLDESQGPFFNDDQDDAKPEPDKTEAPVEAPKTAAPEPPAAAAPPAPAGEDKVKVSRRKRPELPKGDAAPATPAPPAAPTPPASNWEDSLIDDQKAALEDARFAEQVNPKHKGHAEKLGKFFREQNKYLEEHPDTTEEDAGYKRIMDSMPRLSATDNRELADARIEGKLSKKYDSKLVDLEHEIYVRDEEPKVENEAAQIRRHMAFNALPEEMLKVFKEKGLPVLQKEYADELEVAGNLINTLTEDAKELIRIMRINPKTNRSLGSIAADPSHPKWEQHNRISDMVNAVCDDFHKNAPQTEQVRDGKWFVTRKEWADLAQNNPGALKNYWTFSNNDAHVREMINRAMGWMPAAINDAIKKRQDEMKKRGWFRQRTEAPPPPPAAIPPQPSASPSTPRPAPAPPPGSTPTGQPSLGTLLARRLNGTG